MRVLIVHAHPEPLSFCGALRREAERVLGSEGAEVVVSDLYAMGWEPRSDRRNFTTVRDSGHYKQQLEEVFASEHGGFAPDIITELDKLRACDVLILQFPLWWFSMPAILKGWVDRVFAMGPAYGGGRWFDHGMFQGRRALLSITTGGPASMYGPDGLNGDLSMLLYPIQHGILQFTGFEVLPPYVAWAVTPATEEQRAAMLADWGARLRTLKSDTPIPMPCIENYDPVTYRLKSPTA